MPTATHDDMADVDYYNYLYVRYGEVMKDKEAEYVANEHGTTLKDVTADWLPYSLRDSAGYVSTLALVLALGY